MQSKTRHFGAENATSGSDCRRPATNTNGPSGKFEKSLRFVSNSVFNQRISAEIDIKRHKKFDSTEPIFAVTKLAGHGEHVNSNVNPIGGSMQLRPRQLYATVLLACCFLPQAQAVAQELLTFSQLPAIVQKHVKDVRQSCKEMGDDKSTDDEMQGIRTFYLTGERKAAVLVANRNVCSGVYRGANCDTYGCDLLVFASDSNGQWTKIFDEPVTGQYFLSISAKSEFILAALSVTGKYSKLCGGTGKSSYCDFLLFWKQGRWVWQKLR